MEALGVLAESWRRVLGGEFSLPYMKSLGAFIAAEKKAGKVIFPPDEGIFSAFELTPFESVKVVIVGQDPYHGMGQAHGLCFSVMPGIKTPPSLRNLYKELVNDVGITMPVHGHLTAWAQQGVLLLNSVLTVEQANAGAHQGKGWEKFTDQVIQVLNERRENVVFLLWGAYAQKKGRLIDRSRHCVLSAPHPSPLSSHRGFFGCKHFSSANQYLAQHGLGEINWQP